MAALQNAKHERFSQELAKGKSATEAYKNAGYKPNRQAASRLLSNVDVKARLAELQERAAIRTEITLASVTENLMRIAEKAEKLDDSAGLSVARNAWMDAAKVNGLIVERRENENTHIIFDISDKPLTEDEWVDKHVTSN